MIYYVFQRALQALLTLFILVTLVFFIGRAVGDPAALLLGPEATPEQIANLTKRLGLDRSLWVQYFDFVGDILRGDLGKSIKFKVPALELYFDRLPLSIMLGVSAFSVALVFSIVLGVFAGAYRNRVPDRLARIAAVLGASVPNFWLALMLIQVFAVKLDWLPAARYENLVSLILPAITLAGFSLAGMTRLLRSSMVESLGSEYMTLNRAKGVSSSSIIWKHGLRNASIPLLTFAGMQFGQLVSGAIAVETVFALPGVGRLAYESLAYRDFPMVQAITLMSGAIVVLASLFVDIAYMVVDPRIRIQ